jgi:NAD-specific glutamate dehydrogenase
MAVQFSPRIEDGPESPPREGDSAPPPAHRMPAEFPAELFGRAVPDDLAHFSPEQLAAIAADSWAFLAQRSPGTAKVRLASDRARHRQRRHAFPGRFSGRRVA